ncbi:MAG TPA: hypothetical protein VHS81_01665 [Caulobacteraceae bacterium]|nr:hypothetical protein [Caulobacteraceae bacterium]
MTFLKSALVKGALAAAMTAGTLVAASAASADVVCNRANECWHVHDRLDYPAALGMVFHEDAWADAHRDNHYHWRADRFDRGYYRNGVWIAF